MLTLTGENGEIKDLLLNKSKYNKKLFEMGKLDVFKFKSLKHVGKLSKVVIKLEAQKGSALSEWKIESAKIFYDKNVYKYLRNE